MATYKVIQDIEAEDKILGPLTLRQFIYALITGFLLYICFLCYAKGAPYLLILFLPPALFTGFFAAPLGGDQPTEVWALAKIRFYFKPRRRIWDQSGDKELVTITVPKKIEPILTNGLSQNEVKSRLHALANTLDSRGWAVKGVDLNTYSYPDPLAQMSTDRLISMDSMVPQQVPSYDIHPADDMLDEAANPVAQQFEQMIARSEEVHRQQLINQLNDPTPPPAPPPPARSSYQPPAQHTDYWFMNPSAAAVPRPVTPPLSNAQLQMPGSGSLVTAGPPSVDEAALVSQLKANRSSQHVADTHLTTLYPLGDPRNPQTAQLNKPQPAPAPPPAAPSVPAPDPAILSLASNNDLNVATLQREANRAKHEESQDGEVVISLH